MFLQKRLLHMVNDMLDIAIIESNSIKLNRVHLQIWGALINGGYDHFMRRQPKNKGNGDFCNCTHSPRGDVTPAHAG